MAIRRDVSPIFSQYFFNNLEKDLGVYSDYENW